jgi:hypothetical protein
LVGELGKLNVLNTGMIVMFAVVVMVLYGVTFWLKFFCFAFVSIT